MAQRDIEGFALDYERLPHKDQFAKGIYMRNFEKEGVKSLPVFLGRGCAQKCVFCLYNKFPYRSRKLENVLSEIIYLKNKFHYSYFTFADPSFCERRRFAGDFCRELISRNLDIKWSCEARVDTPPDLLELMARAGCISVDFALESGSDTVLKSVKKNIKVHKVIDFAERCKCLGIRSHVFTMVSLPGETKQDAYMTMATVRELSKYCTSMSLAVTQIYPGTGLEAIARDKGPLSADFSFNDSRFYHDYGDICDVNVPLYLENLTVDFIRSFLVKMNDLRAQRFDSADTLIKRAAQGLKTLHKRPLNKNIQYGCRFVKAVLAKGAAWGGQ